MKRCKLCNTESLYQASTLSGYLCSLCAAAEIDRLRALLRLACNSEEAYWEDMKKEYPRIEPEYESWYQAAKKAAGGDDETQG